MFNCFGFHNPIYNRFPSVATVFPTVSGISIPQIEEDVKSPIGASSSHYRDLAVTVSRLACCSESAPVGIAEPVQVLVSQLCC